MEDEAGVLKQVGTAPIWISNIPKTCVPTLRTSLQGDSSQRCALLKPLGKSQGVRLFRPLQLRIRAPGKTGQAASRASSPERQVARIGSIVHFADLAELEALVTRLWRENPGFCLADETCMRVETLRVVAQFVPALGRDGPILVVDPRPLPANLFRSSRSRSGTGLVDLSVGMRASWPGRVLLLLKTQWKHCYWQVGEG